MCVFEYRVLGEILENILLVRIFENNLLVRLIENSLLVRIFENSLLVRIFENVMQRSGPCVSVDPPVLVALSCFCRSQTSVTVSSLLSRLTKKLDVASRAVVVRQTAVLFGSISSVRRYVYGRQMQDSQRQ